jgi:hypothetical protein
VSIAVVLSDNAAAVAFSRDAWEARLGREKLPQDVTEFLWGVDGKIVVMPADDYPPLPSEIGTPLLMGEVYNYLDGWLLVRQSHNRTEHDPLTVPALFSSVRPYEGGVLEWIANEPVSVGTLRTYEGITYSCLQAHTTQSDWTPPATPALWGVV